MTANICYVLNCLTAPGKPGYTKFTEMAKKFYELIRFTVEKAPARRDCLFFTPC